MSRDLPAPIINADSAPYWEGARRISESDRGVVTLKRVTVNQRDEVIQEMEATILYRCRQGG